MSISNEAVEAAAKAFIEHGTLLEALQAAAPHMLADLNESKPVLVESDLTRTINIEGIWTMTETELNRELAKAWDEGYAAGDMPCETAVPCGDCAACNTPAPTNPYRPTR